MNAEQFATCPKCGGAVLIDHIDAHTAMCDGERAATTEARSWLWGYIVAFMLPIFGLPFGLYLYAQDDAGKRGAGTTCLLLSVMGILVAALFWRYSFTGAR